MYRLVPTARVLALAAPLALAGCSGKERTDAAPTPAAPARGEADAKAGSGAPSGAAAKAPQPEPRLSAAGGRALGPSTALRDPPWFHPQAIPGATVQKTGRSEADAEGRYASQILLELPEGTDVEGCVAAVEKAVEPHVPDLAKVDKPAAGPGRVTLEGRTEHYEATIVCGEAKGKVRAFLSYRWTKLPDGALPGPSQAGSAARSGAGGK